MTIQNIRVEVTRCMHIEHNCGNTYVCWRVFCTFWIFAAQLVAHVRRTRRDFASQGEKYQTRQIFSSLPREAETARKIQRTREAAAELPSRSPVSSAASSRVRELLAELPSRSPVSSAARSRVRRAVG